jgi:hypothetical protein
MEEWRYRLRKKNNEKCGNAKIHVNMLTGKGNMPCTQEMGVFAIQLKAKLSM